MTRFARVLPYLTGLMSLGVNALILWPVLAHFVKPILIGQLSTGLAAAAVIAPAAVGGLHVYILRHGADSDPSTAKAAIEVSHAVSALYCYTIPVLGLACWIAYRPLSGELIAAATLGLAQAQIALVRALDRRWLFAWLSSGSQTLAVAAGGAVLILTRSAPVALATVGACILALTFTQPNLLMPTWRPSFTHLRKALRFSLPLVPHLVLLAGLSQGVRILVAWKQGYVAAGYFQFAAVLGGLPITAVIALNGYTSVLAWRAPDHDEFYARSRRYATYLGLLGLALAVGVGVLSIPLLPLWLPATYPLHKIGLAVATFAPSAVCQVAGDAQSTVALRAGGSGMLSTSTAVGTIVAVLTVILFSPALGLVVGGVAVAAGLLARAVVLTWLLRRQGLSPVLPSPLTLALAGGILAAVLLSVIA